MSKHRFPYRPVVLRHGQSEWNAALDLRACGCVLVVSHGNTLRALVKHLESIPDDGIAELELPTGIPLVYRLGPDLRPDALGGQYLDPQAARDGIEAITYRHMTDPEEIRYEEQARR